MRRLVALFAGLCLLVVGLAFWQARDPHHDAAGGFDPAGFFAGANVSAGSIRTLLVFGEDFTARFEGSVEGDRLHLEEGFAFADGERLQIWDLQVAASGAITGTVETELSDGTLAAPVPVEGASDASGVVLVYDGFAPGGGARAFRFRHHMRAVGDGTVRNHVTVSKFGLPLATSNVLFAKDRTALSTATGER